MNALYGQAKYRLGQDERTAEFEDIRQFADRMSRLDHEALKRVLRDTQLKIQTLLDDRYLDNTCWARWDANDTTDKAERDASCGEPARYKSALTTLLSRLYVLRNQIFHGCSTDRSSKNRPSLEAAVPVLEKLVRAFIGIVAVQGSGEAILAKPPYPPSQGSRK